MELGFRIPMEQSVPFQYLSGKLYFVLESKLYSINLTDMTCVFECNILPSKRIFALDRKNLAAEIDSGIIVYNVETCELSRLTQLAPPKIVNSTGNVVANDCCWGTYNEFCGCRASVSNNICYISNCNGIFYVINIRHEPGLVCEHLLPVEEEEHTTVQESTPLQQPLTFDK